MGEHWWTAQKVSSTSHCKLPLLIFNLSFLPSCVHSRKHSYVLDDGQILPFAVLLCNTHFTFIVFHSFENVAFCFNKHPAFPLRYAEARALDISYCFIIVCWYPSQFQIVRILPLHVVVVTVRVWWLKVQSRKRDRGMIRKVKRMGLEEGLSIFSFSTWAQE